MTEGRGPRRPTFVPPRHTEERNGHYRRTGMPSTHAVVFARLDMMVGVLGSLTNLFTEASTAKRFHPSDAAYILDFALEMLQQHLEPSDILDGGKLFVFDDGVVTCQVDKRLFSVTYAGKTKAWSSAASAVQEIRDRLIEDAED